MKGRVLIVEDEYIVALELASRLREMGLEPLEPVQSGDDAVRRAADEAPDLVLMDVRLQGSIDGIEAARQIRARSSVPVVFVTAYADCETLERAQVTEPFGYILKPFEDRLLHATVQIALHRHALSVERQRRQAQQQRFVELVITAQEEERRRVARELHDSVGQVLTSALLKIRHLQSPEGRMDSSEDLLEEVRQHVAGGLDETRRMAGALHPAVLEAFGFEAAVKRLFKDLAVDGRPLFDLQFLGAKRLDGLPQHALASLYRIVQEALANVARHADASVASVVVDCRDATLKLVVEDDGRGFEVHGRPDGAHLGLLGMEERAKLLGGDLTIESSPGAGTTLYVRIPVGETAGRKTRTNVPSPGEDSTST